MVRVTQPNFSPTTPGSAIKETMRMRPPQVQSKRSASKIYLIRRPDAAGFLGAIRIILFGMYHNRGSDVLAIRAGHGNPGTVRICRAEPLKRLSRIRDMKSDAVDSLERQI
jgi:hypothetical protein